MRACFNARTKSVLQPKVPRPDRRERAASSDGDGHGGGRRDQNGDGGREHGDGGCQGRDQPVAAGPKRPPVGRHGRHCGSRNHGMPSSTHTRGERMTDGSEPLDRGPYSAAAARNAAISMMKAVANQSSSGERNEVMGSRRASSGGRAKDLVLRAPLPVHGFGRAGNKN